MKSRTRLVLLAAVGGVLGALCWLPFHLAPLMPLAFVPAMRGFRLARSPREAVYFGLAFGVGFYTVAGHYVAALVTYSWIALILYTIQTLYFLPFVTVEAWGAFWIERRVGLPRTFGFALLHSLFEWTRTLGDLTDPADMYAHAFGTHPAWLVWSSWTGPYFVSLMVLIVAALLELAVEWRGRPARAAGAVAIAAILWLAPPVGDLFVAGRAPEHPESIRVGIVQPSISVKDKLDREQWPVTWGRLEDLSRKAALGADLVLWPESAVPAVLDADPGYETAVIDLAHELEVTIVLNSIGTGSQGYTNSAYAITAEGVVSPRYDKVRLVPFGEYVPSVARFAFTEALVREVARFTPGDEVRPLPARVPLGMFICYEVTFY